MYLNVDNGNASLSDDDLTTINKGNNINSENTNSSSTSQGDNNTTGTNKETETTTLLSQGNIGTTSSAELLEKWRSVIINLDELIIKDCRPLFLSILQPFVVTSQSEDTPKGLKRGGEGVLKIDERFNLTKDKKDAGNIKVMIYNFEIRKEYDTAKMYIRDMEGSTIKILEAIWLDKDGIYFHFDDTLEIGSYFFNISLNNEYESIDIIYDRELKVC